jgi:hypothetical protein
MDAAIPVMRNTIHTSGLRDLDTVDMVVIHYTGSMSLGGTLSWFDSPESKVSAHVVIGREGQLHRYNTFSDSLWHAGRSEWMGRKWCNRRSIGIELVGNYESNFTAEQYDTLQREINAMIGTVPTIRYIVGHDQIAQGRKRDPGPGFVWAEVRDQVERQGRGGEGLVERVGPYDLTYTPPIESSFLEAPGVSELPAMAERNSPAIMDSGKDPSWVGRLVDLFSRS